MARNTGLSPTRRRWIGALAATAAMLSGLLVAPLSAQAAVPIATAVAQILSDTNALRVAAGKPPLVESTALDRVAQNWSAQMYTSGSFVHNPHYSTQIPSGWSGAAENIASGYTYTNVVAAWHQSPGHYANIIGDYNAIGIGYYEANGQTYFTQDFGKYTAVPSPASTSSPTATPSAPPSTPATTTPSPTATQTPAVADSTASTAPRPVVSGNAILDSRTGTSWTAHAVNWPSFEYACQQGWAESSDGATPAAAAAMVSWGITAVRIPLNQDCWLGVDGAPAYGTVASYKTALAKWVGTLNQAGLVVILDLHWTAPSGSKADGQRAMPDAQSVTFWSQVSAYFKNSPSVLFETFNEPYSRASYTLSWGCWKNGGCQVPRSNDQTAIGTSTYTAVGQAQIVAAIRAAGATQPILLDGIDYANDLRGWLANKPNDSQLIASWHNYPGQRCQTAACWNSEIVPVSAHVPVIATEFGETDGGSSFMTAFMTWADAHGIGYAPWAWWVTDASDGTSANLYALITDTTTFSPRAPEGTAFQQHLANLAVKVNRYAGSDRYETAVEIARAAYPSGASTVYVSAGTNFPDALSAAAAAAKNRAPVLLTEPRSLRADVAQEVTALHPDRIVVTGDRNSVSDVVFDGLARIQPNIVRIAGADRYATSRAIVSSEFAAGASTVYIATGVTFPDALSAAAAGGGAGAPVLLVAGSDPKGLDPATTKVLTALHPSKIVIAGGTPSIGSVFERGLNRIAPTVREAGADRFATSVKLGTGTPASATRVFLATGLDFPDALGGSAWAGAASAPLFVVPPNCVPAATMTAIRSLGATRITLLGGSASLSANVAALRTC